MLEKDWWKEAVVYQIYPKSFQDSNGDGIGDLRGIINRLDYLSKLGVNVIWLCPVYQSPMCDGGYDIADYEHINPMFGTDKDMDELIQKASERGIRILMDLVVNHTSDEHPWFQAALKDPGGPYADYYVFRETQGGQPPNNWRGYFGESTWERIGDSSRFYLHVFHKKQPDLNWENPALREEIYAMVNRWLDRGVSGFRVDAIGNIKKRLEYGTFPPDGEDGLCNLGPWVVNQPGIETFLTELNERTFKPHNSMTVAEADVPDELLETFVGENGFFSMVFDFSYTDLDLTDSQEWFRPYDFTVAELKGKIFHSQIIAQQTGWNAVHLENHDQNRSINKFLPHGEHNDLSKKMLACLLLTLRGTPFIYQGEEIGMENIQMDSIADYDDVSTHGQYERALEEGFAPDEAFRRVTYRSRDNARTPMQWSDEKNAGFTEADHTWLKVNPNYHQINVQRSETDEQSVLHFYRELIRLRRSGRYSHVLIYGLFETCELEPSEVIAYWRRTEKDRLLIVLNFQNQDQFVTLPEGLFETVTGNYDSNPMHTGRELLRPYECVILHKIESEGGQ